MRKSKNHKSGKIFTLSFFLGAGVGTLASVVVASVLTFFILVKPWFTSLTEHMADSFSPPDFSEAYAKPQPVDYEFKFTDLDGRTQNLARFKGKVIFLNFWATWCGPCVAEMPGIESVYNKMSEDSVVFVCLSNEDSVQVKKFVLKKNSKLPIFLYSGNTPELFKSKSIPVTFIISADGKLVFKHVGAANWDDPSVLGFLKKLARKKHGEFP